MGIIDDKKQTNNNNTVCALNAGQFCWLTSKNSHHCVTYMYVADACNKK